ncbi:hypothetical protein [Microbulbifer sp.]|uniref:hypothetical protein n=1 Tax=Microbulbifer sp. TaxID=1908541 RepID=UPI003F3D240A
MLHDMARYFFQEKCRITPDRLRGNHRKTIQLDNMYRTTGAIRKPLRERAEATREKILDVARQHFAENRFSGASLRDIARDYAVFMQ